MTRGLEIGNDKELQASMGADRVGKSLRGRAGDPSGNVLMNSPCS